MTHRTILDVRGQRVRTFISHSAEDNKFVTILAQKLRDIGLDVWLDVTNMEAGRFIRQLQRAIEEAEGALVILVLSPDALKSRWVELEMDATIRYVTQNLMHEPIIIEARPIPAGQNIPAFWGGYERYNPQTDPDYLLRVVRDITRATSTPLPPTQPPSITNDKPERPAPQIVLEKGESAPISRLGNISDGVRFEMRWGVTSAAANQPPGQEFDVDYAFFVCYGDPAHPADARMRSTPLEHDVVYWDEGNHNYPFSSDPTNAAITRSEDDRHGGNPDKPDETGSIYFPKLPKDVVRIVVYVHIYKASTRYMTIDGVRTQQLFRHANVRFEAFGLANDDRKPLVAINLGQKYPNNWGIVLCEFHRDAANQWTLVSIERPIDGDYIKACWENYPLTPGSPAGA